MHSSRDGATRKVASPVPLKRSEDAKRDGLEGKWDQEDSDLKEMTSCSAELQLQKEHVCAMIPKMPAPQEPTAFISSVLKSQKLWVCF